MEICPPEFKTKIFLKIFRDHVDDIEDTDWVVEYIRKTYKGSLSLIHDGKLTMITTTGGICMT